MIVLPVILAAASIAGVASPDPRIATRIFDPKAIVVVAGVIGTQTTLELNESEHIENIAIGDSGAWQVTPNKRANIVFVKPLAPRARTNMTVITDQRTYLFDLVAGPKQRPVYIVRFEYPAARTALSPPLVRSTSAGQGSLVAPGFSPNASAPLPGTAASQIQLAAIKNLSWKSSGAPALLPLRTFDDGAVTYLYWPAGVAIPAIFAQDERGTEGPVNFTVAGDYVVVDGVPSGLTLRSGKAVAKLVRPDRSVADGSPTKETAR